MKMTSISYKLLFSAIFLYTQTAQSAWIGRAYNQIKSSVSSSAHQIYSSIRPAQNTIQKRDLSLTPHELKGIHTALKPEYFSASPLAGLALLRCFEKIYHGFTHSSLAHILNDPQSGAFHYQNGELQATNHKSFPVSSWGAEQCGNLAGDICMNRLQEPSWKENFVAECKKSHHEAFGKKETLTTRRAIRLAENIVNAQQEAFSSSHPLALYPSCYLPAVPAAIIIQRAKTKKDLIDYLHAIHNRFQRYGHTSPLIDPARTFAGTDQKVFSGTDFEMSLETPLQRVISDNHAFEARISAETDKRLNQLPIPQKILTKHYGYKGGESVANCAEAALQDLCNIILTTNKTFDLSTLPEDLQPAESFVEFYKNFPSFAIANTDKAGQAWMDLVSGHNNVIYNHSHSASSLKDYEIVPTLDNLLCVLNILFGTTAQSYAMLGKQLSNKYRTITAEAKEKNCATFTITMNGNTVEVFLHVDPNQHAWVDVPQREQASNATSPIEDLAETFKHGHMHDSSQLHTELLLPIFRQKSYPVSFEPSTLAQATHLCLSGQDSPKSSYLLFLASEDFKKKSVEEQIEIFKSLWATDIREKLLGQALDMNPALIKPLMILGANANIKDIEGKTPLMLAATKGDTITCKLLIEHGALVDAQDTQNCTPLVFAANNGHESTCELLIEHGADVHAKDVHKRTPLIVAAKNGNEKICQLLIDHGADVNAKDTQNCTPLMLAAEWDYENICELLIEHGADVNTKDLHNRTPLIVALKNGNEKICKLLIEHNADAHVKDSYRNRTPLALAAEWGHENICELLITFNADVHAKDSQNCTPLMLAATIGNEKICQLLIEHAADANAKDSQNRTPLNVAAKNGHKKICQLLIDHGADVNAKDTQNCTPLMLAAAWSHENICELLIEHGADVNAKTVNGATPLLFASKQANQNICKLLKKYGAYADFSCTLLINRL